MELLNYDKEKRISTITLTDEELVYIHSVLGGVRSTFDEQDATILGIDEKRLIELTAKLNKILTTTLEMSGLKVLKWNEM
jgi:hypothetical protein